MPQRFLRPGITTSKRWNRCDWPTQSLYLRIITLVDDHGRYDADSELLRSHAFPFGDPFGKVLPLTALVRMLRALADKRLLILYKYEGKEYLQLLRWHERARSASKFPEPPPEQLTAIDNTCLPPSPSSLAISHRHSPNGSSEPATLQVLIEELGKDDTYKGIDIRREHGKMCNWCRANKVQPTQRRFINWLNRVDRPMTQEKPKKLDKSTLPVAPEFTEWAITQYPDKADEIKKWKTWAEVSQPLRSEWWREGKSQLTDVLTA
jgi:hypothetical protein